MAKREGLPKRRNGYYYLNDKVYVSVTKVLKDVLAKPALYYWGIKQAARIALEDPNLTEEEVAAQLQLNVRKTQTRGKDLHAMAECLLTTGQKQEIEKGSPVEPFAQALYAWFDTNQPETVANEILVYSDIHGYAGRCDYVCRIGERKILLDFKTGKYIYPEVGLQLAAYKHALSENGVITIDTCMVVLFTEEGEVITKETTDTLEDFLAVKRVWEWVSRKER